MTKALFSQAAAVTIANTVTASALTSPQGLGSLALNSGFFAPGTTLRIRAAGIISATGSPTGRLQLDLVSSSATVVVLDSTAVAIPTVTNAAWSFEGTLTCTGQGSAGTVQAQGILSIAGQSSIGLANTAAVTIDTTKIQVLGAVWTWGTAAAGDSVTLTNFTAEIVI